MSRARRRMSGLEWDRLPETNRIQELVEGEVIVTPPATVGHQDAVLSIASALRDWARRTGAGRVFVAPLGVRLAWDTVLEPDVFFVAAARAELIQPGLVVGAPDLAVEVLSPSTAARDRGQKMK